MLRLLLTFSWLLPVFVTAQTTDPLDVSDTLEAIPFVAYWAEGDVYRFAVTKVDYRTRDGEVMKNDTTRYTGRFEVLDSTETSYTIKWTMEDHSPLSKAAAELVAEVEGLVDDDFTEVIYSTDELGGYRQIENLEEIQSYVKKIVDGILETPTFSNPELPEATRETIRATLRLMEGRQFIETSMFPELRQLHSVFGAEYSIKDTLRYEDEFLVPLWNGSVKAYGTVYLDSVDVSDDYAHLKQLVDIDAEDMKVKLGEYMARLGVEGEKLDSALLQSDYYTYEDNDFHFYYYPGIPIYIDCFRKVYMKMEDTEVEAIVTLFIEWVE